MASKIKLFCKIKSNIHKRIKGSSTWWFTTNQTNTEKEEKIKKEEKMRKRGKVRKISTSSSRFRSIGIEVQPSTPEVEMSHRKKKRKRKERRKRERKKRKVVRKNSKRDWPFFFFFFFFWKGVGRFTLMPSKGDAGQLPFGGRKWLSPWRHLKVWWSGVNLIVVRVLDDGDLLDKGKRRKRKRGC